MRETPHAGPESSTSATRRGLLHSLAATSLAGFAGCSGFFGTSDTEPADRPDKTDPSTTPDAGVLTPSPGPTSGPTGTARQSPTGPVPQSTPPDIEEDLRDQIRQVGTSVRPTVVLFDTNGLPTEVAGVFLEPSVVVTAASALGSTAPEFRTLDGDTHEATLLDRTTSSGEGDDIAAFRIDGDEETLPRGSAEDLSPDDLVVHVGHHRSLGDWLIQFGRVRGRTENGDRLITSVPVPTPGGPVVTLDGTLVGTTVGRFGRDPPPTEAPPPTEPPTVYTNRSQWSEAQHEPISDVTVRLAEWTDE